MLKKKHCPRISTNQLCAGYVNRVRIDAYKYYAGRNRFERASSYQKTKYIIGGKDSCQGDSGGPLWKWVANPVKHAVLTGIVSYGPICGINGEGAKYTQVKKYLKWIKKHTKNYFTC